MLQHMLFICLQVLLHVVSPFFVVSHPVRVDYLQVEGMSYRLRNWLTLLINHLGSGQDSGSGPIFVQLKQW